MQWVNIILANILLIARIFPCPCGARKNITQFAKYPRILCVKPSNKMYICPFCHETTDDSFCIFTCAFFTAVVDESEE